MPVVESKFPVSSFLNNGHLQTIYPYFFRKTPLVSLSRNRIDLKDGDFIDVDYLSQKSDERYRLTESQSAKMAGRALEPPFNGH